MVMAEPLDPDLFADCSTERLPLQVGDKWTSKILVCLEDGPRRFSELQVPLRQVTPKVLTESLRGLERDGMISRTAYEDEVPRRVVYELTPLGRSLFEPLAAQCAWTRAHLTELREARAAAAGRPEVAAALPSVQRHRVAVEAREGMS
jgi:DNA-binding HxlR family transcriptional regulator